MSTLTRSLVLAALVTLCATSLAWSADQSHAWPLIIPNGIVKTPAADPAPRLTSLEGKTLVLRWNGMNNGKVFLDRLAELMAKRLPWTRVLKSYDLDTSLNAISGSAEGSQRIAGAVLGMKPDLVIAAQCDSGACTSWLVNDQLKLERAGVPTITLATPDFVHLARGIQKSHGLTDMCFVTFPCRIDRMSRQEITPLTDALFDDIIQAAAKWTPTKAAVAEEEKPYPAKRFIFTGTSSQLNALYAKRNWSLSQPIVPPTTDRVAAMLKGTRRDPAEVVWVVPPRQGMLTVELVAALGVMAGAKAEEMPLLLSAVEALKARNTSHRTNSAPPAPLVITNGSVVERLDPGARTTGKENPRTKTLWHFVNLVDDVVGGAAHADSKERKLARPSGQETVVVYDNSRETPGAGPLPATRNSDSRTTW